VRVVAALPRIAAEHHPAAVQDDNGVGIGVVEHPVHRCLGAIDAMHRDLADRLQLDRRIRNLSGTPGDALRGNKLTYVRETPVVWRVLPVRVAHSPAAGIHASEFCERRQPPRTFRAAASIPNVLLAQRLFGDPDYLLRVRTTDLDAYAKLKDDVLSAFPGVQRLNSTLVTKNVVIDRPYPID
jgi:DNA-binding Lrp family transcriptional regulator